MAFIANESFVSELPDGSEFIAVKGKTRVAEGHQVLEVAAAYFDDEDSPQAVLPAQKRGPGRPPKGAAETR